VPPQPRTRQSSRLSPSPVTELVTIPKRPRRRARSHDDPFHSSPTPILIGRAYLSLAPLAHRLRTQHWLTVLDPLGRVRGELSCSLQPTGDDGVTAAAPLLESSALVGLPLTVKLVVKQARGLPELSNRNVFVQYTIDSEVRALLLLLRARALPWPHVGPCVLRSECRRRALCAASAAQRYAYLHRRFGFGPDWLAAARLPRHEHQHPLAVPPTASSPWTLALPTAHPARSHVQPTTTAVCSIKTSAPTFEHRDELYFPTVTADMVEYFLSDCLTFEARADRARAPRARHLRARRFLEARGQASCVLRCV
jgi:hypothetical protein